MQNSSTPVAPSQDAAAQAFVNTIRAVAADFERDFGNVRPQFGGSTDLLALIIASLPDREDPSPRPPR